MFKYFFTSGSKSSANVGNSGKMGLKLLFPVLWTPCISFTTLSRSYPRLHHKVTLCNVFINCLILIASIKSIDTNKFSRIISGQRRYKMSSLPFVVEPYEPLFIMLYFFCIFDHVTFIIATQLFRP